ncbi:MAG: carbon-nitrogen hydrolase family protein [Thermoanaerobaculia bacterium]|nr:carbon-nitrogen hydrolase family protein [Thermoanaerobaculia bacterium]
MRVTVCELPDDLAERPSVWEDLVAHVREQASDLVLLPELPFCPWIADRRPFQEDAWTRAVSAHEMALDRFTDLAPAVVVGTRPVGRDQGRRNEVFVASDGEVRAVHQKVYLPDEEGFWEASWYQPGDAEFRGFEVADQPAGALVCTEIWFGERARELGRSGMRLLLAPRATAAYSADKWVAGGRVAAVVSGAFCLSSNRGGVDRNGVQWAGQGWVIHPEEGDVLGLTSEEDPFLTLEIDPEESDRAKLTYRRYVRG